MGMSNVESGEVLETWIVEAFSSSGEWVGLTSVEASRFEEAVGLGLTVFRESGTVFYSVGAYSLGRLVD